MSSKECHQDSGINEGRWQPEEHIKFLQGIMIHGKDWKSIQKIVKTRSGSQVRSHSQKFFIKLNKIHKERRKGKNKQLQDPTEYERSVIDNFKHTDITQKTPPEITNLLNREWPHTNPHSHFQNQKMQHQFIAKNQEKQRHHHNLEIISSYLNTGSEDSYFMKILKQTGDDSRQFSNLIIDTGIFAFGGNSQPANQEPEEVSMTKKRKKSFVPPEENENENLEEMMNSIRKKMGYE